MDNNTAKLPATIPSALETTMLRVPATFGQVPAPMPPIPPQAALPPSGPPGLATAPSVTALLHALRRRWPLAVVCAGAAAVLAVATVFFVMPPKYLAEARLLVQSRPDQDLGVHHQGETEFVIFKANLPSMLKSPLNLSSALNQKISANKFARDLAMVREREGGIIDWLETAIKTDYNLGPEILKVKLGGERGDEVADLLNAVVISFLQNLEQKEKARADDRISQLQERQKELEQELFTKRRDLAKREQTLELPNLAEQGKKLEIAMSGLNAVQVQHLKIKVDKTQAEQELVTLQERQKNLNVLEVPDDQLDTFMKVEPRFQGMYLELAKAEQNYQQVLRVAPAQAGDFKDKLDRVLKTIEDRREEARPELEKAWRTKVRQDLLVAEVGLADKLKYLNRQEGVFLQLVRDARAEVDKSMPGGTNVPAEIMSQRDKIASMEKGIAKIAEEIIVLRGNTAKTRVSLLQRATEPQNKDTSRQFKIAGAGAFGMFGLVLVGVAFLEFRSRKVGAADDVARGLGMTVLGTVPPLPEQARKPLAAGATQYDMYWQSRLMESIDGIRTMLLHTSRNDSLRVIMVTSAVGGEGKTSLASQLAASLARAWKRTLLIDGDLRNPASHKLFNVPLDPGFSEVLRGDAEPAQAIRATSISRLWTLPAGHWDPHAVQALAQDQVRTMFLNLRQQYDFIIIDSCPILPVADSLLLAQHADGVVFSVMRDVSRMPAVWAAQQRLQNLGIRSLGAVVIGDRGDDLAAANYKYALAYTGNS